MQITTYIKGVRKKLGLTQEALADAIDSKQSNIAKYETGRAVPPGDVLLRIQELDKQNAQAV